MSTWSKDDFSLKDKWKLVWRRCKRAAFHIDAKQENGVLSGKDYSSVCLSHKKRLETRTVWAPILKSLCVTHMKFKCHAGSSERKRETQHESNSCMWMDIYLV